MNELPYDSLTADEAYAYALHYLRDVPLYYQVTSLYRDVSHWFKSDVDDYMQALAASIIIESLGSPQQMRLLLYKIVEKLDRKRVRYLIARVRDSYDRDYKEIIQ